MDIGKTKSFETKLRRELSDLEVSKHLDGKHARIETNELICYYNIIVFERVSMSSLVAKVQTGHSLTLIHLLCCTILQAKNVSSLVQNGKQADSLMVRQMHLTGKHTYIILNKCADDTQHVLYNLNAVGSVGPVQAQLGAAESHLDDLEVRL